MTGTLRAFAHNAHNRASEIGFLEDVVDDFDVLILTEAAHLHGELTAFAHEHGLTLLQEPPVRWRKGQPVPEHGDVAMLVPKGSVRWSRVRAMRRRWTSPVHGRLHAPRRGRRTRLVIRGQAWRIAADHWPTQHPVGNLEAVAEAMRAARRWLRRGLWAPSALFGDLNTGAAELIAWGSDFGAWATGHGPDNVVTRGCTATRVVLGKGDSDHHAIAYTLTRP